MAGKSTAGAQIVRQAKAIGWPVRRSANGHVVITTPNGSKVTLPYFRGEPRGVANTVAHLRRVGFYEAVAEHEAHLARW